MSRWSSRRWLTLVVLLGGLLAAGHWLSDRYRLGLDRQQTPCLPYRVFLVDLTVRTVTRGDYVAFRSDQRLEPFFLPGSVVIKQVLAVAGDRVTVTAEAIYVNHVPTPGTAPVYGALPLAGPLGVDPANLTRDEEVPAGRLWVMGTVVNSFDSRYWGFLNADQIVGRAYAVW